MKRAVLALCLLVLLPLGRTTAAAPVEPYRQGSYAALLKAHAGRPLIVHFWSLTCAPCLAEMPRWAQLQERHPDLAVVLVSTDPIGDGPRLAAALDRYGAARLPSMAFADPFTERLFFEVDRHWRGELPRSQMIGRDGTVTAVVGTVDEAVLQHWLARQGGAG